MKTSLISHAVRYGLLAGAAAALTTPAAFAQDAAQSANQNQNQAQNQQNVQLKKIQVTGTLIPRTSIETAAPITIITAKQIQASGFTTIAQVVRSLASDNSGTIPLAFTNGFATGSSGVALRGLTAASTLVLIDGRRTTSYPLADDGTRSFTDLNTLPLNAVERVEVLNDGASAIYGADAIAGVINIILYPSFNGSRATAQLGFAQKGGGASQDYTFITGTGNLDTQGWNSYLSVEYHTTQPIYSHDRDYPLNSCDYSPSGYFDDCFGGNPANGGGGISGSIYGVEEPATLSTPGNLLTGVPIPGTTMQPIRPCPTPVSYPGTGPGSGTGCTYNQVGLYGQIAPKTQSASIDGRITVDINPTTTAYLNASYNQFRMVNQNGGPASIQNSTPTNTSDIALQPTLPGGALNPNDLFANQGEYALIGYNFGGLPGFGWDTTVNHVMRMDMDLTGALSENWSYNASVNLNHAWLDYNNYGFLNISQLLTDVTDGSYNFIDPSANSQATLNALSSDSHVVSTTNEDALQFVVNGPLAQLPGGPLGLGVGTQWRYESQDDPSLNPGNNLLGLGNTHASGQREIAAGFAELNAPVLSSLDLDLAGREDHYSDFGNAFSPKFGIKWTPISQLAFRGTYARGFLAPSFSEIGNSSSLGFITFTPPPSFVAEHCAPKITPCTPDAYAKPYALGLLSEANPDIQPERSRNYTLGAVFQPTSEFSGTLDYYNILVSNLIQSPSPGPALGPAFVGLPPPAGTTVLYDTPDPLYPTAQLLPIQISAQYTNANELRTTGFDVELQYNQNFGNFTWHSQYHGVEIKTWCETFAQGGPCVNMVGTQGPYELSSGAGTPKFRQNWANTFTFGPVSFTGTFYWVSDIYMSTPDAPLPNEPPSACNSHGPTGLQVPPDCTVPAFWYLNLTGMWNINNTWALTAGILNATDRSAPYDPIDYAATAAGYNPTYAQQGAIGRFYQVGLQVTF
ncbi:MAG: TonB-dependent receptor plug domain-containing protein [Gammaproteobacteria bacterium]